MTGKLEQLESESIFVIREVLACFKNPVLLYSVGKDSSVLLHLLRKACFPAPPPVALLHIDTTWKFREMIAFRDATAHRYGVKLIVRTNEQGVSAGVTPFSHSPSDYTRIMKTQMLRNALDEGGFDVAIGGARRDEEKSRAKERIFSVRSSGHTWDPRTQRPELWNVYNHLLQAGETMRAFPLSNWTEMDVWHYIAQEAIPIPSLYFAKPRPVVERAGLLVTVDDERFPLRPDEVPKLERVRFRTLGCYPLTGAIRSDASDIGDVISEMQQSRMSERQGRAIDFDQAASMEANKREGYF